MGTLSKALAGYGSYVCCSEQMQNYLVQHHCIYTTAPPPVKWAALGALDVPSKPPIWAAHWSVQSVSCARKNGLNTLQSESQIIPVVVGQGSNAYRASERQDILVGALIPHCTEGTASAYRWSGTQRSEYRPCHRAYHARGACMKRLLIIWMGAQRMPLSLSQTLRSSIRWSYSAEQKRCSTLVYPLYTHRLNGRPARF